jgi:hypothetical protein
VVPLADDDVGGFDERPLQVGIALLHHASVAGTSSAGG